MKEALYGPGEIIINEKEINDRIYIVFKGNVEMFIEKPHYH